MNLACFFCLTAVFSLKRAHWRQVTAVTKALLYVLCSVVPKKIALLPRAVPLAPVSSSLPSILELLFEENEGGPGTWAPYGGC